MLSLWRPGDNRRYCDGLSRRSFLKIGGLAMGGLTCPLFCRPRLKTRAQRGGRHINR